jgi:integrase
LTRESKNLDATEIQTVAGEKPTQSNSKGRFIEYIWHIQKQGYKSAQNRIVMIKRLLDLGANLDNPETIKDILAKQKTWSEGYKMLMVYAYENYLHMIGLTWARPRYKQNITQPFIPTEEELNALITGSGKQLGTFLQGLKDTGADPGELAQLKWIDINFEARRINIKPVKGHKPRYGEVTPDFIRRVKTLSRHSEYVFNYKSLKSCYKSARKKLARNLSNPRLLEISFKTFRHWKGTMEYHRTHDIIYVKELLGHKRIENTMIYINLEKAIFSATNDEYYSAVAKNAEEACRLTESGFEYVTGEYNDGGKIFRKRK